MHLFWLHQQWQQQLYLTPESCIVMGSAMWDSSWVIKLTPYSDNTYPYLELCADFLAVELAKSITKEINIKWQRVHFFTWYISWFFYSCFAKTLTRTRKVTKSEQWNCVDTDQSPSNHGTRIILAAFLWESSWLCGPEFFRKVDSEACRDLILRVCGVNLSNLLSCAFV